MNAIQFIKDHGVDKAREVLEGAPEGSTHIRDSYGFIAYLKDGDRRERYHENTWLITLIWQPNYLLSDLKRLVDSVDLVEKVGGISQAKYFYDNFECVHIGLDLVTCRALGKAIADHESIYGDVNV